MGPSFSDLGFCNISRMSLDRISFFSCCFGSVLLCSVLFLLLWFCLCVFSFFIRYWKESPNDFFVIGFRYKVRLTVFSCRANGRWFTILPLIVTVNSHGTSSQPTTFDCKPWTTKKLRYTKINTHKSIRKQPFLKLGTSKMKFFLPAKMSTLKVDKTNKKFHDSFFKTSQYKVKSNILKNFLIYLLPIINCTR